MPERASLRFVDPAVTATILGVLLSVAFGAFATAFAWLRADMNARLDKIDARLDKMDARIERLETVVHSLIVNLARSGHLTEPIASNADD